MSSKSHHKNQYFKHSLKCLLTESPLPPTHNNNDIKKNNQKKSPPSIQLTPKLQLTLSNHLKLNFSDKTLQLLLDKSKDAFKDTFHQTSPKDPEKFLNTFKENLTQSIQQEDLLNYFNLLIPSIHIQTETNSPFKNLILDFNLNHNQETQDNQINVNLKGRF